MGFHILQNQRVQRAPAVLQHTHPFRQTHTYTYIHTSWPHFHLSLLHEAFFFSRSVKMLAVCCVCITLFLSWVSTSPGAMCLSRRERGLWLEWRVAKCNGVISSRSFNSQLACRERSNFMKRTLPYKQTQTHNHIHVDMPNYSTWATLNEIPIDGFTHYGITQFHGTNRIRDVRQGSVQVQFFLWIPPNYHFTVLIT